jgi:hypothetical protein
MPVRCATGGICEKGERCGTGESGEMSANGGTSKTCGKSRMRRALETLLPLSHVAHGMTYE